MPTRMATRGSPAPRNAHGGLARLFSKKGYMHTTTQKAHTCGAYLVKGPRAHALCIGAIACDGCCRGAACGPFCHPTLYVDLASCFTTGKFSELEAFIQANAEKFQTDNNFGLVKQVLSSLYKRNIQRLTQTYLTLSLQDIANTVNLNSAKDAEMRVLQMIQDGEIFATINQKDGMVSFHEDPEQYKTYLEGCWKSFMGVPATSGILTDVGNPSWEFVETSDGSQRLSLAFQLIDVVERDMKELAFWVEGWPELIDDIVEEADYPRGADFMRSSIPFKGPAGSEFFNPDRPSDHGSFTGRMIMICGSG
ncbi:COP9 signalosome complex subunit 3 [Apostasia shenzhenica]|uniref:COP9 signalosome complex subunit 3 n=1 Tax=Apostasia shenzhenica TaxID=1088818 RepID=A0A2I0BDT1_9ASPA|nr:COP9 signalosome complex subunit 3 [Apostasia shenzhenica]